MAEPTEWIEKRMANALLPDAKIGFGAGTAMGRPGRFGLGMVEKAMGGLWVGGTAYLTSAAVEFHPNGLNKAVHAPGSVEAVVLPLLDITDVKFRKGIGTNIVDITTTEASLSIRAYNMATFAEAICDVCDAAQGRGA
ncbi:MAG: hypothetical protein AAF253_10755 [Pseudomonadota bacterium]